MPFSGACEVILLIVYYGLAHTGKTQSGIAAIL